MEKENTKKPQEENMLTDDLLDDVVGGAGETYPKKPDDSPDKPKGSRSIPGRLELF